MPPKRMTDRTLIARSTSVIAAACVVVAAVERGQDDTTPPSTMPRPAGVNGIAVSSEAIRATKKAAATGPSGHLKPSASTTK